MLPQMLAAIDEGYDSCATYRKDRVGESVLRTAFSKGFYKFFNSISAVRINEGATDFRLMTRKMVNAVVSLGEKERFTKGLFQWVGFKSKYIVCESVPRVIGKSKFNFMSLFKYAINGIVAFSTAPLRLAVFIGFIVLVAGFGYMGFTFIRVLMTGITASGFATIVILILLVGGVIIMLLGVIGEYIARIYHEIKSRPIFVMRETNIQRECELDEKE